MNGVSPALDQARAHLAQLAPHGREREGAQVLEALVAEHERALAVVEAAARAMDAFRVADDFEAHMALDDALGVFLGARR